VTDRELPEPTPEERELSRKLRELAELEESLAGRELALATLEAELHVFQVQYLETVGRLYADLDEIEAEIAEREAFRDPGNTALIERAEAARSRAEGSADALDAARDEEPESPAAVITKDRKTGLPLIECKRNALPQEELTPERVADILLSQEVGWHVEAGR